MLDVNKPLAYGNFIGNKRPIPVWFQHLPRFLTKTWKAQVVLSCTVGGTPPMKEFDISMIRPWVHVKTHPGGYQKSWKMHVHSPQIWNHRFQTIIIYLHISTTSSWIINQLRELWGTTLYYLAVLQPVYGHDTTRHLNPAQLDDSLFILPVHEWCRTNSTSTIYDSSWFNSQKKPHSTPLQQAPWNIEPLMVQTTLVQFPSPVPRDFFCFSGPIDFPVDIPTVSWWFP